jgi:hypothetical protein
MQFILGVCSPLLAKEPQRFYNLYILPDVHPPKMVHQLVHLADGGTGSFKL